MVIYRFEGLIIINITDPTNPSLEGGVNTAGNANGIALNGSYLYLADYTHGLFIANISESTIN